MYWDLLGASYRDDEESLTGYVETRTKWYMNYALKGEQDFTYLHVVVDGPSFRDGVDDT